LNRARELGYGAVLITGHPSYYPRFGFRRADDFGITLADPTSIFDGAFMALELIPGYLGSDGGKWYEDSVYEIDAAAFSEWNKGFMAEELELNGKDS